MWNLWKTRNNACFQRIVQNDPTNVILSLCRKMDDWTNLQKGRVRKMLSLVAGKLRIIASEVLVKLLEEDMGGQWTRAVKTM